MKQIDSKQIKLIHVAISKLRIEDHVYRQILHDRYGVRTCKDLSYEQASDLIDHFKRMGFRIKKKSCSLCRPRSWREKPADNITYLVSQEQLRMIDHLRQDIHWKYHDGYWRWLRNHMGIERIRTSLEASKVIEGLKAILKSQQCKRRQCAAGR